MTVLEAQRSECLVFTYKEGVLSPMAHDLELRVTRFTVELDERGLVHARFDAGSLEVVGAVREGAVRASLLSSSDRDKIQRTMRDQVLEAHRFPEIRFDASEVVRDGERATVRGQLQLHGRSRELHATASRGTDGRYTAQLSLHQPDFGITPYRAMLGALRVKADVTVHITLPDA